ncbi:hypothetical protein AX16_005068 [Volvariella volvacea WC 439]|nr:hypothetical protein AX16_005068 [Volvariella volvacea WC 439]
MPSFVKLFSLVSLAATVSAASVRTRATVLTPAQKAQQDSDPQPLNLDGTGTDIDTIMSTIPLVNQKTGANDNAPPSSDVPPTVITAIDGNVTVAGTSGDALLAVLHGDTTDPTITTGSTLQRRDVADYTEIFGGTGRGTADRDASIQGTAYLTYTVVSNDTYNIDACLGFCDSVKGCVFANLYYELNNDLPVSNLKCAVYGDVHSAAEKTNFGGQQLLPLPSGLTFIQESSGWASNALVDPPVPEGYELTFGPEDGANNSPGYMGFAFLDKYDVQACANLCNTRGADGQGGACQYFNIWRAVVNGNPTTYTCSMYFVPSDSSTATNFGQGDLKVTFSRGYRRQSALADGGFEGFSKCSGSSFCFGTESANWIGTSDSTGFDDATIFNWTPYAHSGNSVGILGSATGADNFAGTLTYAKPLDTISGRQYTITFFHSSSFSSADLEADTKVEVVWNGDVVGTITPGFSPWTYYHFEVEAKGQDTLAFHGGKAPAWSFIDDVFVFLL